MSLAIITIDTTSQSCSLAIDGVPVNADEISFSKSIDYDGNTYKNFAYSIKMIGPDNIHKKIEYRMVSPEEMKNMMDHGYSMEKNGLASRIIDVVKSITKDVINYINKGQ